MKSHLSHFKTFAETCGEKIAQSAADIMRRLMTLLPTAPITFFGSAMNISNALISIKDSGAVKLLALLSSWVFFVIWYTLVALCLLPIALIATIPAAFWAGGGAGILFAIAFYQ